jgi:RNA polymerase sigma-70 factor (ECF subfamily)
MNHPASDFPAEAPGKAGAFPTTHWSLVVQAGAGSDSEARTALEQLCRQYWYPLYAFVRRQGRAHHAAEDCTQEFLVQLIANERMARAQPERGRFRTFLLSSLRNFLTNQWHRDQAAKRGGGQAPLPLEFDTAEQRFAREIADSALTPEQAFERNWARSVIDRALADLRREYERSGRGALFALAAPHVWGNAPAESLAQSAGQLKMTADAFTVALHRLRKRLGQRLRQEVAQTVANDAEVDAELRHLIAAVGGTAAAR